MVLLKNMSSKTFFILVFIQTLFGYTIFDHIRDIKNSSSNFVSSYNQDKEVYNFSNPACNSINNKYLYSSLGTHFNGILNTQQLFFNLNTNFLDNLNIAFLRSSIDDINNTTDAWNDNGDGIININEIDYNEISTFNHNTLGLILSKPFVKNNFQLGVNSKISISNLVGEHSFSTSFDLGIYQNIKKINFGLVIKDIFPHTYWTTGKIEKGVTSLMLGSSFNIGSFNASVDLDPFLEEYFIGLEYNYNSLVSVNFSNSTFEKFYLGLLINFEKFSIGYSFALPNQEELGPNQQIILGLNKFF